VRGGGGGDLGGHCGDVAGIDHAGSAFTGRTTEAAGLGDRRRPRQNVLHIGVRAQQGALRVRGIPEAARPASISACHRRRAMGESAEALLVAMTTCPAPGAKPSKKIP